MKNKILIILSWLIYGSLSCQTTTSLTVTDSTAGNPGSADVILSQAVTLANGGQHVIVNMNAPYLCNVNNISMSPTSGTITIQKDPTATIEQGFGRLQFVSGNYPFTLNYGLLFFGNETIDINIKNITFKNYSLPVNADGINNLLIDGVKYLNCVSMLYQDMFIGNASLMCINTTIQNCSYENVIPVGMSFYPAIWRSNTKNTNIQKSFKILNNHFKSPLRINIDNNSPALIDMLDLEIKNNFSNSNYAGWSANIGVDNNQLDVEFENNQDVKSLILVRPKNDWKILNNVFDYKNFSDRYLFIFDHITNTENTGFIGSGVQYCSNLVYLNNNNTFKYHSSYPYSTSNFFGDPIYGFCYILGNTNPGCAVTELSNLDLPGNVNINENVSVRKCKIFSSGGKDSPITNTTSPISATISSNSVSGGNLMVNYNYTGITGASGNDLYVDFYKSNINGDLLEYIGEQFIPNSSISGSGIASVPVPGTVTLNSADRIAMTLTGLNPLSAPTVTALGTSNAFYPPVPPSACISPATFTMPAVMCASEVFSLNPLCPNNLATYTWSATIGNLTFPLGGNVFGSLSNLTGSFTVTLEAVLPGPITYTSSQVVFVKNDCPKINCPTASEPHLFVSSPQNKLCAGEPITFTFIGNTLGTDYISMGEGCEYQYWGSFNLSTYAVVLSADIVWTYSQPGTYVVEIYNYSQAGGYACTFATTTVTVEDCGEAAPPCQSSFKPSPGDYVVSFWVKEDLPSLAGINSYSSGVEITLNTPFFGPTTYSIYANSPSNAQNKIIDGWQKVEAVVNFPGIAPTFDISLKNKTSASDVYFDDIRVQPFNSSFKSYVYDPVSLRLVAELDERNYATFYEYDEEGQLIRVKKETERGIKTIKESKTSVAK